MITWLCESQKQTYAVRPYCDWIIRQAAQVISGQLYSVNQGGLN